MYRQFDNPLMEEYVYKRRTERGTRMFSKEGGIKAPMKMVKEGGALGVLSDQFVWEGVYVPFFGKVTGTTPLPALLRKRTGADMVAIAVRTDSPGHWIADMRTAFWKTWSCSRTAFWWLFPGRWMKPW